MGRRQPADVSGGTDSRFTPDPKEVHVPADIYVRSRTAAPGPGGARDFPDFSGRFLDRVRAVF